MILWVKSVPQHHLSSHIGHHNRTEVAHPWGRGLAPALCRGVNWSSQHWNPVFHHTLLCKCQVMALQGEEHHLSPLHVLSMWCFAVGREGGPCRRLLLLLLPLLLLCWPGVCSGSQEGLHVPSKESCGGTCATDTSQPHSWVLGAELTACSITHPWIQCAASWGWRQMHRLPPDFGGNHLWLFHKSEFSK